jgi:hypothetical protein
VSDIICIGAQYEDTTCLASAWCRASIRRRVTRRSRARWRSCAGSWARGARLSEGGGVSSDRRHAHHILGRSSTAVVSHTYMAHRVYSLLGCRLGHKDVGAILLILHPCSRLSRPSLPSPCSASQVCCRPSCDRALTLTCLMICTKQISRPSCNCKENTRTHGQTEGGGLLAVAGRGTPT